MKSNQIKLPCIIAAITILGIFAGTANAAMILSPGGYTSTVWSDVRDGDGSVLKDQLYPSGSLWDGATSIDNGLEFSTATYDFTQGCLKIDIEHVGNSTAVSWLSNTALRQSARSLGAIALSVDVETPYNVNGHYNTIGNRRAYFRVSLVDTQGGQYFENIQDSRASVANAFVVGQQSGDYDNVLTGSQSGTLYPGRIYGLSYEFWIENYGPYPDMIGIGTAEGEICFLIPEPTTLCLMFFGVLVIRRKQRN
jgi:hypothetical protein